MKQNINYPRGGGGGGLLPLRSYTGKLHPKGVLFSGFRYNERVGILLTEVFKRGGKSVIWACEMAQSGAEQMNFMTLYSRGNVLFL